MDSELYDHIDHQRWLLEHGFINDLHKDNIYMYGAIIHKDIENVEVDIDVSNKIISYRLFCKTNLIKLINKYHRIMERRNLFDLWRLKRLLKKQGSLNFHKLLSSFIKDYCGPKWSVKLDIKDVKDYIDEFEEQQHTETSTETDKQSDA